MKDTTDIDEAFERLETLIDRIIIGSILFSVVCFVTAYFLGETLTETPTEVCNQEENIR